MTKKSSPTSRYAKEDLLKIQEQFHELILAAPSRSWNQPAAEAFLQTQPLPEITNNLIGVQQNWFPVEGMYGGFKYELVDNASAPTLIVQSWSRVIGGSGQTHRITPKEMVLVETFDT